MLEQLFLETPNVEVWPTFESRVLSRLAKTERRDDGFTCVDLQRDTYDNHFRFRNGRLGFMSIITVHNLLRLQIDGRPGHLKNQGEQNVFYCQAAEENHPGFSIQIEWKMREYDKFWRWLVLGWELPKKDVWPDWGTFRPARTRIFWR